MNTIKRNIVWLASYPKSGNTWFRAFLSNLLSDTDQPVHINELKQTPISSNRAIIDGYLGTLSSELSSDEIDILRPQIFKRISEESDETVYIKTHESWGLNTMGTPLFPKELTKAVIYIIRNPLDVVTSYAIHNNTSVEESIVIMNDREFKLCADNHRLYPQTQQFLSSWSEHVISWVDRSGLPVHLIRYEDMLDHSFKAFEGAVRFLDLKCDGSEIENAVQNSSFEVLKEMESADGFKERSMHSEAFFRSGKSNEWKNVLTKDQINQIVDHHSEIMQRFGYMNFITQSNNEEKI